MVTLFHQLNRDEADTFSLVLDSAGIGNRVTGTPPEFCIEVPVHRVDAAMIAIKRYQAENPPTVEDIPVRDYRSLPKYISGIALAIVILCIHLAVTTSAAPEDYIIAFGANARRILSGEIYRCATALLLHADAAHVAGNMVAMALFGGAVCAVSGSGVGWLMILSCGVMGNLVNAMANETGHLSVGASTAVFGSVGILCTLQAVKVARTRRGWKGVLMALGAGIALLAFLGTSARSDLGAHLFGFLAGVMLGGIYGLRMEHPMGHRGQVLCGTVAVSIILMAWVRGVLN